MPSLQAIEMEDSVLTRAKVWSPGEKQSVGLSGTGSREGYLLGSPDSERRSVFHPGISKEKDRRLEDESDYMMDGVGQLVMEFDDGVYVGTAFLVDDMEHMFLVTCAHNLVQASKISKPRYCKRATWYRGRDGQNKYLSKHIVHEWEIYPGYLDDPTIDSGKDLAVARVDIHQNEIPLGSVWLPDISSGGGADTVDFAGQEIRVKGYPAEYAGKRADGLMVGMGGTIARQHRVDEKNAVLIYNNIDTSGGQSGSPVMCDDQGYGDGDTLAGVHVGYLSCASANIATKLSGTTYGWIGETGRRMCKGHPLTASRYA